MAARKPSKETAGRGESRRNPDSTPEVVPSPPKPIEAAVTPAKGRPMLNWVGKRPLSRVRYFPAQHVETFEPNPSHVLPREMWTDWPTAYSKGGLLFHGDNKEILGHLL